MDLPTVVPEVKAITILQLFIKCRFLMFHVGASFFDSENLIYDFESLTWFFIRKPFIVLFLNTVFVISFLNFASQLRCFVKRGS